MLEFNENNPQNHKYLIPNAFSKMLTCIKKGFSIPVCLYIYEIYYHKFIDFSKSGLGYQSNIYVTRIEYSECGSNYFKATIIYVFITYLKTFLLYGSEVVTCYLKK